MKFVHFFLHSEEDQANLIFGRIRLILNPATCVAISVAIKFEVQFGWSSHAFAKMAKDDDRMFYSFTLNKVTYCNEKFTV